MIRRLSILLAFFAILMGLVYCAYSLITRINFNSHHQVGEVIDTLNGVNIYYNGGVNTHSGRNLSIDGYNLGIQYQCVEFVKRYFYQRYQHKMPDALGHARDFFDNKLSDGMWNEKRAMWQYTNASQTKPMQDDLLVFSPWIFNPYGHVAIIASVTDSSIEIAQQNPGPFGPSRERLALIQQNGLWYIDAPRVKGWLRWQAPEITASPIAESVNTPFPSKVH